MGPTVAYDELVTSYRAGLARHWDKGRRVISGDSFAARGEFAFWFEIYAFQVWNSLLATRLLQETSRRPSSRSFRRYLPVRPSVLTEMNHFNDELVLKLAFHQLLLSGAVLYVDNTEIDETSLKEVDYSVVRNGALLTSIGGNYGSTHPDFSEISFSENKDLVSDAYDRHWQTCSAPGILKLAYRYPYTFDSSRHYVSEDMERLLLLIQGGRCPCPSRCNLEDRGGWAIDHIVPRCDGGTNVIINLRATCREFNSAIKRGLRETFPPDYRSALKNMAAHAPIAVGHEDPLYDQRLGEQGLKEYSRVASLVARRRYGKTLR